MSAPATPPVWNVRMVSWVPGSPIDWAAMMPTASPISHMPPVARKDSVTGLADTELAAALEHRSNWQGDRRCGAALA